MRDKANSLLAAFLQILLTCFSKLRFESINTPKSLLTLVTKISDPSIDLSQTQGLMFFVRGVRRQDGNHNRKNDYKKENEGYVPGESKKSLSVWRAVT